MSTYTATVSWKRKENETEFAKNRYSRVHEWEFDGGVVVPASSSPGVVPLPYSDEAAVDPEEAFLASLSSCHMLWFLSLAAKKGYVVDEYDDSAEAIMGKNGEGKLAITKVILRPAVKYSRNAVPVAEENTALHHDAHEKCFIASSVRTEIEIEPVLIA